MSSDFSDANSVQDLVLVQDITENAVHTVLKTRFSNNLIYTYIGPVLISLNPFCAIPGLVGVNVMQFYRDKMLHENPPHVYAITDIAYFSMLKDLHNQCVIITGESGSGKTEASKILMAYIATVSGNSSEMTRVKDRLLDSNPILESFGNAKTLRNDNSSRFGKYLNICFNIEGLPVGGMIQTYMLEKTRVVNPGKGERNYHIFYQICRGSNDAMKKKYKIQNVEFYNYLNKSGCVDKRVNKSEADNIKEDQADFKENMDGMKGVDIPEQVVDSILKIVSGVLWIGQIEFKAFKGDVDVAMLKSNEPLEVAAELLEVSPVTLEKALIKRQKQVGKDWVEANNDVERAFGIRDSLASVIYQRLFEWLVTVMNKAIDPSAVKKWWGIGVLDIYGFEIFESNSFEQFCINFVNEKLQQLFIEKTLKEEQQEYAEEKIQWTEVAYFDNKAVCELIEGTGKKGPGIITHLCDTCDFPKGDDKLFLEKITHEFKGNQFFKPGGIKLKLPSFVILHYAGEVVYGAPNFVAKNKDEVTSDLLTLMEASKDPVAKLIFPEGEAEARGRKKPPLAGRQFATQVQSLVDTLTACSQYFIRCVKSNDMRKPMGFDDDLVRHQIRYLGLLENIKIRRAGFAFSLKFEKFLFRYRILNKDTWPNWPGAAQDGAVHIVENIGMKCTFQCGVSKIYFKEPEIVFFLEKKREIAIDREVRKIQARFAGIPYMVWWRHYRAARKLQAFWKGAVLRKYFVAERQSRIILAYWRTKWVKLKMKFVFAGIIVQKYFRKAQGVSFRRNYKAATKLQAYWRMSSQRRFWSVYRTASALQGYWKGGEIRNFVDLGNTQATLAAYWRKRAVVEFRKEFDTASYLIASWREREMKAFKHEHDVASKLQAFWKGACVRRWQREFRAATQLQARWKAYEQKKLRREYRLVSVLHGAWRKKMLVDHYHTYRKYSAVQTIWRTREIILFRKEYKLTSRMQAAMKTKELMNFVKTHYIVNKIQAVWRTKIRKHWYDEYRVASTINKVARKKYWMRWIDSYLVISTIQNAWRAYATRTWFRKHLALRKIQGLVRKHLGTTSWKKYRAARTVQAMYRGSVFRSWLSAYRSATVLHTSTKRFLARREYRRTMACTKLQAVYRMHVYRTWWIEYHRARHLQAGMAGAWMKKKFILGKSVFIINACLMGFIWRHYFVNHSAAVTLQRNWRRYTHARMFNENQAAVKLQRGYRALVWSGLYRREHAAVVIQSNWKSYMQHSILVERDAAKVIRWSFKMIYLRHWFVREMSATKIQKTFRMSKWRKMFLRYEAAKLIQTNFRSSFYRRRFTRYVNAKRIQALARKFLLSKFYKTNKAQRKVQAKFRTLLYFKALKDSPDEKEATYLNNWYPDVGAMCSGYTCVAPTPCSLM